VVAAGPAALVGLAFGLDEGFGYWAIAAVILARIRSGRRQHDTPAGLAAASRWRAVKARLEQDAAFPSQPPTAIALWERHLAYGAALGVAAGAVRPIPMGAESERRAWSSYGGRWRQVEVSYPNGFPLGWGLHPFAAILRAVPAAVLSGLILYILGAVAVDLSDLRGVKLLVAAAIFLIPSLVAIGAVIVVARSVADLSSTSEVTGEILRLRAFGSEDKTRHYVAVDGGTASKIRAWIVRSELYSPLEEYQVVSVSVTPRLGYVRSITALAADARGRMTTTPAAMPASPS
jgi:hypothetical protein